jgi:hypothetical protein
LRLIGFALPVGSRRKPRRKATRSQATLSGFGVQRHRMLPLGVAKWQGTFALFGPLQAKCGAAARARGDTGEAPAEARATDRHATHAETISPNATRNPPTDLGDWRLFTGSIVAPASDS